MPHPWLIRLITQALLFVSVLNILANHNNNKVKVVIHELYLHTLFKGSYMCKVISGSTRFLFAWYIAKSDE